METALEISPTCKIVAYTYEGDFKPLICLEYVEHSPDPWYSNSETSFDLEPAKIQEIIDFLTPFAKQS
jgi:hypothetical protein